MGGELLSPPLAHRAERVWRLVVVCRHLDHGLVLGGGLHNVDHGGLHSLQHIQALGERQGQR
jgi:hypothetical protein